MLSAAALLLLLLAAAALAMPMATPAQAQTGHGPAPHTYLAFRQNGEELPLVADAGGVVTVSLDRAPFELLFSRALLVAYGLEPQGVLVNILISTDPQLFRYIRRPYFEDRIGPAHAYAIPPAGEHYLMLTDVDFDIHLTAHNAMFGDRLDIDEPDAIGMTVDTIVGRDMTDRLAQAPDELYLVVVILLEPPSGREADPNEGLNGLTPALVDYVVLSFPE
ncbi:MAG: hypothetical protein KDA64_17395 [Rhodospirillaceae bacterium]|nr:hypothetical protein [Rhodospirillaceae bacterium]